MTSRRETKKAINKLHENFPYCEDCQPYTIHHRQLPLWSARLLLLLCQKCSHLPDANPENTLSKLSMNSERPRLDVSGRELEPGCVRDFYANETISKILGGVESIFRAIAIVRLLHCSVSRGQWRGSREQLAGLVEYLPECAGSMSRPVKGPLPRQQRSRTESVLEPSIALAHSHLSVQRASGCTKAWGGAGEMKESCRTGNIVHNMVLYQYLLHSRELINWSERAWKEKL